MARVLMVVALCLAFLVRGGQPQQQAQAAPAPALIRGAEFGTTSARGVVGDVYIGCLESHLSRCFATPTLACVEDAMVDCSLDAAAAAAPTTCGPAAAPLPVGAEVVAAFGGEIVCGIATAGAQYISCLELDLVNCYSDPTMDCVERAIGAC